MFTLTFKEYFGIVVQLNVNNQIISVAIFYFYICLFKIKILASGAAESQDKGSADDHSTKKTSFSLKLTKFEDAKKIALIKEIRGAISGLNLVQAKKFVDSLPGVVKEDLSKQEAEELKAKLEKVGATCEIVWWVPFVFVSFISYFSILFFDLVVFVNTFLFGFVCQLGNF